MCNKLIIEVLGTFFLCLSALLSQTPLTVAAVLCAMIYMGGSISGAHYNPAVTLAVFLRKKISPKRAMGYIATQIFAAVCAAILVGLLHGHSADRAKEILDGLGESSLSGAWVGWLGETLGTFILAFVVLMVATSRMTSGNSYFGLAIALTVFGIGGIFSPISLSLNPAVQIANDLTGPLSALNAEGSFIKAASLELTFLAQNTPRIILDIGSMFFGGALAAALFVKMFPEDK